MCAAILRKTDEKEKVHQNWNYFQAFSCSGLASYKFIKPFLSFVVYRVAIKKR